jgi:hypothetical protein
VLTFHSLEYVIVIRCLLLHIFPFLLPLLIFFFLKIKYYDTIISLNYHYDNRETCVSRSQGFLWNRQQKYSKIGTYIKNKRDKHEKFSLHCPFCFKKIKMFFLFLRLIRHKS